MTWKPPELVKIGSGQFMNVCRPPSAAMRSAPGRKHEVIGIAEHDLGAGRADVVGREPLHRALRADGHEGRCLNFAVRCHEFTAAGGAVGFQQVEGEGFSHHELIAE